MSRVVPRALEILLVCGLWLTFAPARVGGAATYVTVSGNSMNPTFHTGDMVVLVRATNYQVGDIIAYHSRLLGGVVIIHRIIRTTDDGRFVTKGDHNEFVDPYDPRPSDVLGRRALRVPGASQIPSLVQRPAGAATLAALAGVVLVRRTSGGTNHRRRARRG